MGITNGVQGMLCKENGTCTFLAYLDNIKTVTAYEINPYSKNAIQLGQIDSWIYGARILNDYKTIVTAN